MPTAEILDKADACGNASTTDVASHANSLTLIRRLLIGIHVLLAGLGFFATGTCHDVTGKKIG